MMPTLLKLFLGRRNMSPCPLRKATFYASGLFEEFFFFLPLDTFVGSILFPVAVLLRTHVGSPAYDYPVAEMGME